MHSLEDSSCDDEDTHEDKSDIGYISDASTEGDKVAKIPRTSTKQSMKESRKRKNTSKLNNDPPRKAKKIFQNQV